MLRRRDIDPTTNAPHDVRTFWSVQAMRALAATMIVIGHAQTMVATALPASAFRRLTVLPWGASVDLFFVISGFVMVHASRRLFGTSGAARAFLLRRLVRVVPLYWLATMILLALLAAASLKGGDPFPRPLAIAASLAFMPFDTWGDGKLMPVLDLGWTLNYELFFYLLFALLVGLPRRAAIGGVLAVLIVLTGLGGWAVPGTAFWFWSRPILIDFALGMLVGAMVAEGWRMAGPRRVTLAAIAAVAFAADPLGTFAGPAGVTVPNEWPRVLFAGLPCAALLAAATLGPEPRAPAALRPVAAIGDASYSLYLLHPFVLIVLAKLVQKLPPVAALPSGVLAAAAVIGALAVALVTFRYLERPTTAYLTAMVRERRFAAVSRQAP